MNQKRINRGDPIDSEKRKEGREGEGGWREKKGAWGTSASITKNLTFWSPKIFFPSGIPEEEGEKSEAKTYNQRNNGWNFSKFDTHTNIYIYTYRFKKLSKFRKG